MASYPTIPSESSDSPPFPVPAPKSLRPLRVPFGYGWSEILAKAALYLGYGIIWFKARNRSVSLTHFSSPANNTLSYLCAIHRLNDILNYVSISTTSHWLLPPADNAGPSNRQSPGNRPTNRGRGAPVTLIHALSNHIISDGLLWSTSLSNPHLTVEPRHPISPYPLQLIPLANATVCQEYTLATFHTP